MTLPINLLFVLLLSSSLVAMDVVPPKGCQTVSSMEDLLRVGAEQNRVRVILMYLPNTSCPLHNGQVSKWMGLPQLAKAVLMTTQGPQKIDPIMSAIIMQGRAKAGPVLPVLYFVDEKGGYLDLLPYKGDDKMVQEAMAKFFPANLSALTPEDVAAVKAQMGKITKAVESKKLDAARADVKKLIGLKPKLGTSTLVMDVEACLNAFVNAVISEVDSVTDEKARKAKVLSTKTMYKGILSVEQMEALK